MALRSLGSTLLAKALPGTALREKEEKRNVATVNQEAQAVQPGAVQRTTVQQPLEAQVPAGTQKVVSVQPIMEPRQTAMAQSAPAMSSSSIVAGMGSPGMVGRVAGREATGVSGGEAPGAKPATGYQPVITEKPVGMSAFNPAPAREGSSFLSDLLASPLSLGARVLADVPKSVVDAFTQNILEPARKAYQQNTQQWAQETATSAGAPRPAPTPTPPFQAPSLNQYQASLATPKTTPKSGGGGGGGGGGSWSRSSKPSQQSNNIVRSIQEAAKKATNWLRSLFK